MRSAVEQSESASARAQNGFSAFVGGYGWELKIEVRRHVWTENFGFAFRLRTNIPHLPRLAIFSRRFPSQAKSRIGFALRTAPVEALAENWPATHRNELWTFHQSPWQALEVHLNF
jgi:hypothetical protein